MQSWPIFVTLSLLLSKLFFYYPCDAPITYRLGTIDPRFKLSQTIALQNINSAVAIWGQHYFREDPTAKLTVNFVYDDRQSLVTHITSSENQITSNQATLETKIATFNAKRKDYEHQVAALNADINEWNRKGGAPEDVYHQLLAKQQQLSATRDNLQTETILLNAAAKKFNLQVDSLNTTITTFNTLLTQKPEAGLFDPHKAEIAIYFVTTQSELVHTLAHEFGHALGMSHVDNPQSIMYTFTSTSLSPTAEDIAELTRTCTRVSKFHILLQFLQTKWSKIPVDNSD